MLELESPFDLLQSKSMAVEDQSTAGSLEEIGRAHSPTPRPGHALVRVRRAGVAFGDIIRSTDSILRIKEFPWTPGYDISGDIVSISPGKNNTNFPPEFRENIEKTLQPGTAVAAFCSEGGYSQYVELPLELLVPIPDNLGYDKSCALVLNYLTAWQMMFRVAQLPRLQLAGRERPSIFVQSAAGGVGTAVLQLAQAFNIRAYGTASPEKHDLVRSLGGIPFNYNDRDMVSRIYSQVPEGLDAVFETRGFDSAEDSRKLLKRRGKIVLFGFLEHHSNQDIYHRIRFSLKGLRFFLPFYNGRAAMYLINPRRNIVHYREDLERLLHLGNDGIINPVISAVYPLEDAQEAWNLMKSRKSRGKFLLDPFFSENS